VEAFLDVGELWGGTGSIVDRAGAPRSWVAQHQIQEAFIALGEMQITHGYVNPGVTRWVAFLKERRELQRQYGGERAAHARQVKQAAVPWKHPGRLAGSAHTRGDTWGHVRPCLLASRLFTEAQPGSLGRPGADSARAAASDPCMVVLCSQYHASAKTLGFVSFRFSVVAIGIGLLLAFILGNGLYANLLHQFGLEVQRDMTPLLRRLSTPWPFFAAVVLVAPVVEETFFRGFVFCRSALALRLAMAAAISSALFAAAHMEITFFIPAFASGYLLAYLYQRSNSIWPGLIIHALVNVIAVTAAYSLT